MEGNSVKLLVVEDDAKLTALLAKGLNHSGYVVETSSTAKEAWELAINGYFDAIILDVKLPDEDGISMCSRMRKQGITTPLLMLTARDSVDDKVNGLLAGADDYMTKPFSFAELRARLTAITRRPTQYPQSEVLRIRNIELCPETREVRRDGVLLAFSHKEFAVLELLLRNANHVLTRDTLLDRVWGTEFESNANVVDVVIARIRIKLGDSKRGRSLIQTVRGVGYRVQP